MYIIISTFTYGKKVYAIKVDIYSNTCIDEGRHNNRSVIVPLSGGNDVEYFDYLPTPQNPISVAGVYIC